MLVVGIKLPEQSTGTEGWKVGSFSVLFHGLIGPFLLTPCTSVSSLVEQGECFSLWNRRQHGPQPAESSEKYQKSMKLPLCGAKVTVPSPQAVFQAPCPCQKRLSRALFWALISGPGGGPSRILSHHMKVKSKRFLSRECQKHQNTREYVLEPVSQ